MRRQRGALRDRDAKARTASTTLDVESAKLSELTFANVAAGLLDVLGDLAAGERTEVAVKKAIRRGRARRKALEDAEKAVRGLDPGEDET